jgi:hypothetical protein
MKHIIALWNNSNKGKTKTLVELKKMLLSQENVELCKNEKLPNGIDFSLVIRLFGKTIGIESQGDPNSNLKKRLEDLISDFSCDVIFCTTRTRGATVNDLKAIADKLDYWLIWTSTYQSWRKEEFDVINELKAKHLFELLQTVIENSNFKD